jgi:hypothetical protein
MVTIGRHARGPHVRAAWAPRSSTKIDIEADLVGDTAIEPVTSSVRITSAGTG